MNSTRLRLAARSRDLILFRCLSLICLTLWKSNQRWPPHQKTGRWRENAGASATLRPLSWLALSRSLTSHKDGRTFLFVFNSISFQFPSCVTGHCWWRVLSTLHIVHQQLYEVIYLFDEFDVDFMWTRDGNVSTFCVGVTKWAPIFSENWFQLIRRIYCGLMVTWRKIVFNDEWFSPNW